MEKITKIYPNGVIANKSINFSLNEGEIHALAGENGAGKSTIMKILFGLEKPTSGSIYLHNELVNINSPADALRYRIGMVHQHFMLIDNLTVAENIFLGIEPKKKHLLDYKTMVERTREIADKYHMSIDPNEIISNLSVSQKQKVEILKVLVRGARIIILDEPTAVLTPQETEELFKQLLLLKQDLCTIIIITHKLKEIKQLCDRVTILRQGKDYGVHDVKDISIEDISRLMVGSDVGLSVEKKTATPKKQVLSVSKLKVENNAGKAVLDNVSFDLHEGEILCVAGVEGNGQQDLIKVITGSTKSYDGTVTILGEYIRGKNIAQIRKLGLAHIPEDRMTLGVNLDGDILDNLISLKIDDPEYLEFGFINYRKLKADAKKELEDYKVKYDNANQPIRMLSGGNMQKVIIARELARNPKLLVADQFR
jgi:simple sugar transport system ATP-binding protein